MSLIKKIDVEKHFAARRAMRLGRVRPASQPHATGIKPPGTAAHAPRSTGDLSPGHSSRSVSSASIPITSDFGRNRLLRPPGSRQQ